MLYMKCERCGGQRLVYANKYCPKCHQEVMMEMLELHGVKKNEERAAAMSEQKQNQHDAIRSPKHYSILDGVESITIIASAMTVDEWRGFCLGNIIKYRLRAGNKDKLEQDISKADYYKELFEKHKHLCLFKGTGGTMFKSQTG